LFEPLPIEGILVSKTRVVDLIDKGKGALILADVATFDQKTGRQLAIQQFGTFQVGGGGFGGIRSSPHERATVPVPSRAPDRVIEQSTSQDQAALYRLGSGDLNPLHIDPQFAQMSGFDRPILHGLCSLGFSTRHILKAFANNDATRFKAIKVRFSMPVLPGQTLQTEMWKQGDRIHFQTKVKETGKVVLTAGYMDLWPVTKSAKL